MSERSSTQNLTLHNNGNLQRRRDLKFLQHPLSQNYWEYFLFKKKTFWKAGALKFEKKNFKVTYPYICLHTLASASKKQSL